MNSKIVKCLKTTSQSYDGTQLRPMFCYEASKGKANIVLFIGAMRVTIDHMVDCEDVLKNDDIKSDNAINIIAELPFVNLLGGIALQRIMIRKIADIILEYTPSSTILIVQGDDIKFKKKKEDKWKKLSVSIATTSSNSVLIHIGLNIFAGKSAPTFAGNLKDTGVPTSSEKDFQLFLKNIVNKLEEELNDIYKSSMKVLPK